MGTEPHIVKIQTAYTYPLQISNSQFRDRKRPGAITCGTVGTLMGVLLAAYWSGTYRYWAATATRTRTRSAYGVNLGWPVRVISSYRYGETCAVRTSRAHRQAQGSRNPTVGYCTVKYLRYPSPALTTT